jgi:CO/xanthine dehydrogenase FAD-binding subunit
MESKSSKVGLSLGAGVTMSQIREEVPIPALQEAARQIGAPAIQNVATIGGNVFAHQPHGDAAVALLALDATVTIADAGGERSQPLVDFYDDGVNSGRLLTKIEFAEPKSEVVFLKCGRHRFNSPTAIAVAFRVVVDGGAVSETRIAVGGAGPRPMRCALAEEALTGAAFDEATIDSAAAATVEACSPATDAVATEWYRRRMMDAYLRRALGQLA